MTASCAQIEMRTLLSLAASAVRASRPPQEDRVMRPYPNTTICQPPFHNPTDRSCDFYPMEDRSREVNSSFEQGSAGL